MIYDGINLESIFGAHVSLEREVVPPKPVYVSTKVPGRSGALVSFAGYYEDAELTYRILINAGDEHNRAHRLSMLHKYFAKGKKRTLIDPRDGGYSINALCKDIKHERIGIKPTLNEIYTVTFECDPYKTRLIEYKKPIGQTFEVISDKPCDYTLELTCSSACSSVKISNGDEYFTIKHAFKQGNTLKVNSLSGQILINNSIAQHTLGMFDQIFKLKSGTNNVTAPNFTGLIKFREEKLIG